MRPTRDRSYDRGEKLEHYQRIPSLREVLLVAHDERLIEIWRRGNDGAWSRSDARSGSVTLTSVPCTLAFDEMYHDELTAG